MLPLRAVRLETALPSPGIGGRAVIIVSFSGRSEWEKRRLGKKVDRGEEGEEKKGDKVRVGGEVAVVRMRR